MDIVPKHETNHGDWGLWNVFIRRSSPGKKKKNTVKVMSRNNQKAQLYTHTLFSYSTELLRKHLKNFHLSVVDENVEWQASCSGNVQRHVVCGVWRFPNPASTKRENSRVLVTQLCADGQQGSVGFIVSLSWQGSGGLPREAGVSSVHESSSSQLRATEGRPPWPLYPRPYWHTGLNYWRLSCF